MSDDASLFAPRRMGRGVVVLLQPFTEVIRYRRVIIAAVRRGLRDRTVGSTLGAIWLVVYPLIFLAMYALVFVEVLRVRVPNLETSAYVLAIFCGLVPFLAFAEGFGAATNSIVSNGSLVRNTLFPIELIPFSEVIVGHVSMGIGMVMVWIAALAQVGPHWSQLFLPLIFILQIMITAGFGWIAATLNVFFRDVGKLVPILTLFLMLVSPIGYTAEMVPAGLQPWLGVNPLASLIEAYRTVLLAGSVPLAEVGRMAALAIVMMLAGYYLVVRLKTMFSDYV
jgi:lipopolysaccharide transport system permease protein